MVHPTLPSAVSKPHVTLTVKPSTIMTSTPMSLPTHATPASASARQFNFLELVLFIRGVLTTFLAQIFLTGGIVFVLTHYILDTNRPPVTPGYRLLVRGFGGGIMSLFAFNNYCKFIMNPPRQHFATLFGSTVFASISIGLFFASLNADTEYFCLLIGTNVCILQLILSTQIWYWSDGKFSKEISNVCYLWMIILAMIGLMWINYK